MEVTDKRYIVLRRNLDRSMVFAAAIFLLHASIELLLFTSLSSLPVWIGFGGGILFLCVPFIPHRLIPLENITATLIAISIPILCVRTLYTSGASGAMPIWFCLIYMYTLVYNSRKTQHLTLTFCTLAYGLTIYASSLSYYSLQQEAYPKQLAQLLPLYAVLSVFANLYLGSDIIRAFLDISDQEKADRYSDHKLASVGRLAGQIAHEINTPLTTLQINIDSIARITSTSPTLLQEIQPMIDIHHAVIGRIAGIVRTVLDMAKGGAPETCSRIAVADLLLDVKNLFFFSANHRELNLLFS